MYQRKGKQRQLVHSFIRSLFFKAFLFIFSLVTLVTRFLEVIIIYPVYLLFYLIKLPLILLKRVIKRKRLLIKVKYFLVGSVFGLILIVIYQSYVLVRSLPNPHLIGNINYPVSTKIFDRKGKLLYEVYRDQNRTPTVFDKLPRHVVASTIAIEDKDFYKHHGISLFGGIIRAIKENLLTDSLQGGSTITQQLVKTALLTPERTVGRKVKEIILALWAERLFTKNQILEMYLNQVPYGGLSYGIEEASQAYFGQSARYLSLPEAAFLAGLPQAPSLYSPYNNPILARQRRDEVLKKLKQQKYITDEQYHEAVIVPLTVKPPKNPIKAPHFVFYVKSLLEQEYGIRQVEEGGLRVYTSLDLEVQEKSEKVLQEELLKIQRLNVNNGAVLVTVPRTGEIVAMVGGRDYFASPSGAFNVALSARQPGSLIKPVMYSLALEKGYTAATILEDTPVTFTSLGAKPYRPVNYDGRFHGNIPLRYALANSYNVPAVKVLSSLGVSAFIEHARSMGITTWTNPKRYGLSLTLGGGEIRMIDAAGAFGSFASQGDKVEISPFLKVTNHQGKIIYKKNSVKKEKVILPETAFIISDILSDNFARRWAFGERSSLEISGFRVAVKTGTTNDKRDNWTLGYTPQILTMVWVGNNDNSPMNPYLTSGITGAAPIWHRVMRHLLQSGKDIELSPDGIVADFKPPEMVTQKVCYFGRVEYFIKGTEETVNCSRSLFSPSPTPTR